jgi:hypothetical protein
MGFRALLFLMSFAVLELGWQAARGMGEAQFLRCLAGAVIAPAS